MHRPPNHIQGVIGSKCKECGFLHPPGPCMVGKKNATDKGVEVNLDKFIPSLNTIIKANVDSKGIKDVDKLLGFVLVEIQKAIDSYKQ